MIKDLEQLKGAMYILECLWDNSYYSMGSKASERIEKEFVYYLGKNWAKKIGKLTDGIELKPLAVIKG